MSGVLERAGLNRLPSLVARHPAVLLPCALYLATLAPSFGLADTVILVDAIEELRLDTHANNHNLTVLLGRLFFLVPVGEAPYRANLASAAVGGAAMAAFYWTLLAHYRSRVTAAVSMLCLAASQSMWWHSTIIECYALNALFTVLTIHLLLRLDAAADDRYLHAFFFVSGLAVFNHIQMGVLGLAAVLVLALRAGEIARSGDRRAAFRLVAACSVWGTAGLLPYLATFAKDARAWGLAVALDRAAGGSFKEMMLAGDVRAAVEDLGLITFLQFPTPFLAMIGVGVLRLARRVPLPRHASWGLAVIFLVNTTFFAFYRTWDRFAFLLPSFVILAFVGAGGVDAVRRRLGRTPSLVARGLAAAVVAASIAWPPVLYSKLSAWGREPGIWRRLYDNRETANTHDGAEYRANPNKRGYRDVEEYLALLFGGLPPGAIYVDDDSRHYYAVRYEQLYRHSRRDVDVRLVNSWGFADWGMDDAGFAALVQAAWERDADLFLVSVHQPFAGLVADLPALFEEFPLDGRRWIYKLVTRRGAAGVAARLRDLVPAFRRLVTKRAEGVEAHTFDRDEPVWVAAEMDPSRFPLPLTFRWLPPSGGTPLETVTMIARGQTAATAVLQPGEARGPGDWKVQVSVGDRVMAEAGFTVSR